MHVISTIKKAQDFAERNTIIVTPSGREKLIKHKKASIYKAWTLTTQMIQQHATKPSNPLRFSKVALI